MFRKITILAATTAISLVNAGAAFAAATPANNIIPAAALNGNGASSVANVLVQELNCFGGTNKPLGLNGTTTTTGGTVAIPDHVYTPTNPTAGNAVYDCGVKSVQDLVTGQYVSTGSGAGKNNWKNLSTNGDGGSNTGILGNPFTFGSNIQFAFSDSPIVASDISTYNTKALPTAGAPIQIPMYVLPVAVAYSPVYGKIKDGAGAVHDLELQIKFPHADGTGGLRMKRATYCAIFNGTITNWNSAALQADNGGQSLMDPADDAARWTGAGVPIKLVGRFDNSGTTNIFSRHLGTVCGSKFAAGGNDQLPATAKGTAVYDKTTGALTSGAETAGLFGLVSGSDGIAQTVDLPAADPANPGDVTLNGRLGYVGADWVRPSDLSNSQLHSADLQIGTSTKFAAANAVNAAAAFKGILPPQSATNGKYTTAAATGQMTGTRSNPLAWVFPATTTYTDKNGGQIPNPIAAPTAGYPIVGTTNMLLYTCYASKDVRNALQNFMMLHLGKVTADDTLVSTNKVPAKLMTSTTKGGNGLLLGALPRNGLAPLPTSFVTAIVETFLTKVTTGNNPGALNLYIQDKLQKKSTDALAANPNCTTNVGA